MTASWVSRSDCLFRRGHPGPLPVFWPSFARSSAISLRSEALIGCLKGGPLLRSSHHPTTPLRLPESGLRAGPIFCPPPPQKQSCSSARSFLHSPPIPHPFPCLGFSFQWLKAHLLPTPSPHPCAWRNSFGGGDVEGLAVLGNTGHLPRGHQPAPANPSSFPGCSMRPERRQPCPPDPMALPRQPTRAPSVQDSQESSPLAASGRPVNASLGPSPPQCTQRRWGL